MATLAARLDVSIDRNGLDASLSAQGDLISTATGLVEALKTGNVPGLAGFVAELAALDLPDPGIGGDAVAALARARAALSTDLGAATGGTLDEIARFADTAGASLLPVLEKVTGAARAIEVLARMDLRCPPTDSGTAAGGGAATEGDPAGPADQTEQTDQTGAARAQGLTQRLDEVDAVLALLPEPFSLAALVSQLTGLTLSTRRNDVMGLALPVVDDVLLPLQTLVQWETMSDVELSASLRTTLEAIRQRLDDAGPERLGAALSRVTVLVEPLDAAAYVAAHQAVLDAGGALRDALEAADTAEITTAANALGDALDGLAAREAAIAADFTALATPAARGLKAAPGDVADHLVHLAVQLEPVDPASFLAALPPPDAPDPELKARLEEALSPITDFMEDLTALLDLSAVQDGIAGAAGEAQQMADRVQGALAEVTGAIRAAFAEAEGALDELDLDELAARMRVAIAAAGAQLGTAIAAAFEPFKEALETALTELSAALDALDFEAVAQALQQIVDTVAGVLGDPAVRDAVEEVRGALEEIAQSLRSLSFAPVTDEVIDLIEKMTAGLRAVTEGDLNDAVKGLLGTALSVLPPDLKPATEPLTVEFGRSIEVGPVVLVERIRAEPARILGKVRAFDPAVLAGGSLGKPFRALNDSLGSVSVEALMAPVRRELRTAKSRLKVQAAPSKALAPVVTAFDVLRAQIDALSPDAVLDPIEAALREAVDKVLTAAPVEAALAEIGGVFDTLEAVLTMLGRVGGTLERLEVALDAMAGGDASLDEWRDTILARFDDLTDGDGLTVSMTALRDAASATGHAPLLARFDADAAPMREALDTLAPRDRQAQAAALRQRLGTLARSLPAGPAAEAVAGALARFDPVDPAATAGLRAAAGLDAALTGARARLEELAPVWSAALHGEGATLRLLAEGADDPTALRGLVEPEVERALGPVRALGARLAPMAPVIGAIAGTANALQARITASLGDPLTGPDGLAAIVEAMERIVATLRGLDLDELRSGVQEVFDDLKAKVDALGPRPLVDTLDREFAQVVDGLDLELLLPQGALAGLDAQLDAIRGTIAGIDPEALIVGAVRPAWERDVLPMVAALDLTPVFDALIDTLRELEGELRAEIDRVNGSYKTLLAARPAGIGGVSVSVSIG